MATQARSLSMPLATPQQSSGNIISQVIRLIFQPVAFFRAMPGGSQWVMAALLVLTVTGYTATTQVQSTASTSSTSSQSTGFDLSLFGESTTQDETTTAAQSTQQTQQTQTTTTDTTTDTSSDTVLMNALIAASGMLVMWLGQTVLLSMVSMFRGFAPQVGKSFQIAVWASLPLALMLGLRYVHYSTGGEGGALGLSLLLEDWNGLSILTDYGQRIAAVFMSNLTLFWLWNLLLLYLGARYVLGGRRFMVFVVVVLWIVASTLIPALVGEPETRTAPRQTTTSSVVTQDDTTSDSTTQQTQQTFPGGGTFPSGDGSTFPGGGGTFPGGGAPPGG